MTQIGDETLEAADDPGRGEPTRRMPGEAGVWIFLFGDMVVFGVFFATFMVQRARAPELFDASRQTLSITIGLINTLILLTSSLFVVTGIRAIRADQRTTARLLFLATLGCGLAFVGLKAIEYTAKVHQGHTANQNAFYLYYFILTGLHLFHVLIGIVVLTLLAIQARRVEPGTTSMAVAESGACFWHLVDLLWIVLFPLLYLVS